MATSLHDLAPPTGRRSGANDVRIAMAAWLTLALLLIGLSVGRASDRDETALTVQVSSADHELAEGYFALGAGNRPLPVPTRQRRHKVKIVLQESGGPELSKLER
jgi:hypothetical protein